ncbi:retropepsin-like aspartic protease, partial [Bosea sp. (in: a-proteobacteria)]|uniref:retropepsin-like aspartic protease n=1 Tax=Bosea sp. (in: a-proteobacteria) TaxID=1871050 RepID=UPI004034AB51
MHFSFEGTVDGHVAQFLCDTGATHSFVSADFVSAHNLPVHKYAVQRTWLLADNASLSCNGFVSVPLSLPGHEARCKLTVMPKFVKGYDVLLGDDWLFANQATLSYEHKTLSLARPGEPAVQLPCHSAVPPAAVPAIKQPMVTPPPAFLISAMKATVPMATAKVAARWLRKGGRAVVAVIS